MKNINTNYKYIITKSVLNTVLRHDGMLLEYDIDKRNPDWIIDGPLYNPSICTKFHVTVFEIYIINAITDIYNLICSTDAINKQQPSSDDDSSSDGGNALPSDSTTELLISLGATIYFIDCWIEFFDHNYLSLSDMYVENMKGFLKKISAQIPKSLFLKEKRQLLLHDIGVYWKIKNKREDSTSKGTKTKKKNTRYLE